MAEATLGQRIRALRQAHTPRLTQKALGEAIGYTPSSAEQTVWAWEKDRVQVPSADLPQLADALGVDICALFGRRGHHQPKSVMALDGGEVRGVPRELIERLVEALESDPERVEIRIMHVSDVHAGAPQRTFSWTDQGPVEMPSGQEPLDLKATRPLVEAKRYPEGTDVVLPTSSGKTNPLPGYEPAAAPLAAEAKTSDDPRDRPAAEFELGQSVESEEFTPSGADRDTRAVLAVFDSLTEEQRADWLAAGRAIRREKGGAG